MRFIILIFSFLLISCGTTVTTPKDKEVKSSDKTNTSTGNSTNNTTEKPKPIISISGLNKGTNYNVDGPLWYDGTANLEELSTTEMRISISIAVPPVGTPYQIKDGKINVVIKLVKEKDSKYTLYLMDINKGKMAVVPDVKLDKGKTEAGWFSTSKDYAKITTSNQYYEFTVNSPDNIYISSNTMPGGLNLTKK